MKASLSTHILIKIGAPIILFFILVLVSDFHYLISTLKKDSIERLYNSGQAARQIIFYDMQREQNFIAQLVDDSAAGMAPDAAMLDAMLDQVYLDLSNSIQTIKQLFVFYHSTDNRTPAFHCVNYLFSIIQEKNKISTQAVYDNGKECHADIKNLIASSPHASAEQPFWIRLKTLENTYALLVYPFKKNAHWDGFVVVEIFAEEVYDALRLVGARNNVQTRALIASNERFYILPEQYDNHHIGHVKKSVGGGSGGGRLDYENPVGLGQVLEIQDPILQAPVQLIRQQLPLPGLYIEQYRPSGQLLQFIYSIKTVSIVISVLGLLMLLIIVLISGRSLAKPIKKLAGQAHAIAQEEGHFQLPRKQLPQEITRLASALETMLGALKNKSAELVRASTDKERMQSELKIANTIQMQLLPQQFNRLGEDQEFEIYAHSQAARETGGDIYDFFPLGKERTGVLVADVSGKGIASALLMTMAKIIIKTIAKEKNNSASQCLAEVNNILMQENTSTMFITAFYGILDTASKRLNYAVAGHNPPLLCHADGGSHYLQFERGLALSVMENSSYTDHSLDFSMGDSLLIYTDGLSEAENNQEQAYGELRLQQLMSQNCHCSAHQHIDNIVAAIKSFTVGQAAFDDITMLCLRYRGSDAQQWIKIGQWDIQATQQAAAKVLGEFGDACRHAALTEEISHDLCLALDELVSNSLRHRQHQHQQRPITVIMEKNSDSVRLVYKEPGEPFDMRKSKQAQTDVHWQQRKPGGLGLHLIKQLFDHIAYRYQQGCNVLSLTKTMPKKP